MPSVLNPRYTFAHFVIGRSNDLAAGVASAVAAQPGRAYNPFFIYGETGLGKTHLMQAVAHDILARRPTARVLYVTAEAFRNDYVAAVQGERLGGFRADYEGSEMLLVDDVHVLAGTREAREEFARAFRVLHDSGRQVMLTSDRAPESLGVEARLVRQFRWGKIADLGLPDYEHRLAILKEKVAEEQLGPAVPDAVLALLAEHVRANVRALEGALVRLVAVAQLRRAPVTVDLAADALGVDPAAPPGSEFGTLAIQQAVATEWGTTPEALVARARSKAVVEPRQVAMHLCRELLDLPLAEVGRAFGGRDHSTVIHSLEKVAAQLATDQRFRERVTRTRRALLRLRDGVPA